MVLDVEPSSHPAGVGVAALVGGLPDVHGLEVAEAGVGVAHASHDGEVAVLPQPGQVGQLVVESELVVEGQYLISGVAQVRSGGVVVEGSR